MSRGVGAGADRLEGLGRSAVGEVNQQWKVVSGAENCVRARGFSLSACPPLSFLGRQGLPVVRLLSGLISQVAFLDGASENMIAHCLVLYPRFVWKIMGVSRALTL